MNSYIYPLELDKCYFCLEYGSGKTIRKVMKSSYKSTPHNLHLIDAEESTANITNLHFSDLSEPPTSIEFFELPDGVITLEGAQDIYPEHFL